MVHKLRKAMRQRDDRYTLEGMIGKDEGYFAIEDSEHKTQKAGRGSKTKSNVIIMAESTVLEDIDTGKVDRQCRYFKAKVLENHEECIMTDITSLNWSNHRANKANHSCTAVH